jgi:hypothetical protein
MIPILRMTLALGLLLPVQAGFEVKTSDSRIEIVDGGKCVFGWQIQPPEAPLGGIEKFPISAYVDPLATPSGFDLTAVQPSDHLHHLGLWWPWKQVTVDGKKHVTWELQNGEGRHVAKSATVTDESDDAVSITARNEIQIQRDGKYRPVIAETVNLRFSRLGKDAYVLDIGIDHAPVAGEEVEITAYRYSGFSWRGPMSWTGENSAMVTSGGQDSDSANGQEARWVFVSGPAEDDKASFLMLSGAEKDGNPAERLRVWNSKMHHGNPFINFNPVMKKSFALTKDSHEVASRRYRVVMADRALTAGEAEALWKEWK